MKRPSGPPRGFAKLRRTVVPLSPRARTILDVCPIGLIVLTPDYHLLYANPAALVLVGKTAAEAVGRHVSESLGPRAWEAIKPLADRSRDGGGVTSAAWIDYPTGRRYVMRNYAPFHDADGTMLGGFGFIQDLTEIMKMELKAAENEHLKSAVVDNALDCIVAIDEAGAIVEFNAAAEQTFGYTRAAVIGKGLADVIVPPQHRTAHHDGFVRYIATGEARIIGRRIEIEAMRRGGEVFPVELTVTEVRLPERRLFTAHLRDITERRTAEAELARQRQALHQSQTLAAMGSLLASVAHELNNPLAIVLGQATMLAEEAGDGPLARRAARVREAAARSASVVKTFLAMARQQPPSRRPTDIAEVCRTALRLVDYGLNADGITVRIEADKKVPLVHGDPDQLHQVFANLLVNAQQVLRARPGRRQIRIAVRRTRSGGCSVTFDDSGNGVPEELRERIFDPFFTTKQVGHGTGVGLAVSRSIITAHGGSIVCEASPLGGARFVIELAAIAAGGPETAAVEVPVAKRATRRRALVVDDEVEIAVLLTEIAEAAGWRVDRADDGKSAIQRLKRNEYDLMFADLRMPGLDGRGLADWVAAHRPKLRDAVYFVTGDVLATDGASIPADRLLEKPFDPSAVRRILAAHAG